MPNPCLRIWCNLQFPPPADQLLRSGVQPHQILPAINLQDSNLANGQPDSLLPTADIVFGQIDPDALLNTPSIKWVHLTTAGYERYDRPDFRVALQQRRTILTNSSAVYAEPCAQHILAMMLALARQLPRSLHNQAADRAWPAAPIRVSSHLLLGQTALIIGFGSIARRLAELLCPFHMTLSAVRRSPSGDEPIPTHTLAKLDCLLPSADHIINTLPGGPSTNKLVSASCFSLMKPSAIYYTVGRGSTTDQDALLSALRCHKIAAAFLDVTTPEPLPPDHPLWTTPNCYITPHTAGGQREEPLAVVQHFLDNLHRFTTNQPLRNRII